MGWANESRKRVWEADFKAAGRSRKPAQSDAPVFIIVDTQGFDDQVFPDWTGFQSTSAVNELFKSAADCIGRVADELVAEVVECSALKRPSTPTLP